MIAGHVSGHHALIPVVFLLPNQPALEIEFVVDIGFAGFLTLPSAAIEALGLPFRYQMPANLADDTYFLVDVYTATIVWQGIERRVEVLAMGKRPLVGTALLNRQELVAQFIENGQVTIRPLPQEEI